MKISPTIIFVLLVFPFTACKKVTEKPISIIKESGIQREVFDAKKYPQLTAIGRINFGRKQCSLTLVAKDIAVTAGHCFLEEYHLSDLTRDLSEDSNSVSFRVNGLNVFRTSM